MQTLTYGFKKPESGDKGSVWFPAIEDNIQQLNDHTHNNVDSPPISSSNILATTQDVNAIDWVATSGGMYRQLVTVTGSGLVDEHIVIFKDSTTGAQCFLGVEKVSATTYYVYTNDNTLDLVAYYLT